MTETQRQTQLTIRNDYSGLVASTWDLWRDNTATWSDRVLYLEIIRRYGQPVLDIGCATGRLLFDYLQQGIDIDGLDNSADMIAICRAKAEKLNVSPGMYEQNMESLDLPRPYQTILAPSSVLQLITDQALALAALRRIFDYLQPGGAFITPFFFDWAEGEGMDSGWRPVFEKVRPDDGATIRSFAHSWCEPEKQWWHTEQRFEVELNGEIIARQEQRMSPELRWYTQSEAVQMYQDAGFTDIQLFRGFELMAASPADRQFCVLGVKPGA